MENGRPLLAFSGQDRRCPVTLRHLDGSFRLAISVQNGRAPVALGGHLAAHRFLDITRGRDLLDLHGHHLHAPTIRDFVELHLHRFVDLVAFREHVIKGDITDDGAEGGDRHATRGPHVVLNLNHRIDRLDHLQINKHVDRDGRIVLRNARLRLHVEHVLTQIDADHLVDDGEQGEDKAGPLGAHQPAEAEVHQPLVFGNYAEEEWHRCLLTLLTPVRMCIP